MEFTRHLHKKLRSYCMVLPSPINKWLNPELILLLKQQESQDPSSLMPQHTQDKLDFATSHNIAGSFNRCATLTCQNHCTGFEGCKHLISTATEHLKPVVCSHNHSAAPSAYSCCDFRLQFKTPLFVKSFSSNSAYRALLLVPGSSANCCQEHTPSLCLSVLFLELSL